MHKHERVERIPGMHTCMSMSVLRADLPGGTLLNGLFVRRTQVLQRSNLFLHSVHQSPNRRTHILEQAFKRRNLIGDVILFAEGIVCVCRRSSVFLRLARLLYLSLGIVGVCRRSSARRDYTIYYHADLSLSLSLSRSLSLCTHTRTHAHTRTYILYRLLPNHAHAYERTRPCVNARTHVCKGIGLCAGVLKCAHMHKQVTSH
jgi:hypothetical protein